ncbi:MAG TPA: hypothetical protein VLH15_06010 [Dehalococcoidales bacterium]|nr:hypothetical protein [Dehalococcoidales bacterium]
MVTSFDKSLKDSTGIESELEEFKLKLLGSIKLERDKTRELAEKEAAAILSRAQQESKAIIEQANIESGRIVEQTRLKSQAECESIISRTRQQSEKMIALAEEVIRKEAREKTKKEVESILRTSREEASKNAQKILQNAQEEGLTILANAKNEASNKVRQFTETAEKQADEIKNIASQLHRQALEELDKARKLKTSAQEEAAEIIANAKSEAEKLARQTLESAEKQAEEQKNTAGQLLRKAQEELNQTQSIVSQAVARAVAECRQNALKQAETEAAEYIRKAKVEAQKDLDNLISSAIAEATLQSQSEKEQILAQAGKEADSILEQARAEVRQKIEDSSALLLEYCKKIEQVFASQINKEPKTIPVEIKPASVEAKLPVIETKSVQTVGIETAKSGEVNKEYIENKEKPPAPVVQSNSVAGDAQNKINNLFGQEGGQNYNGKLKIDIAPPADSEQINELESHLVKSANLRVLARGGAADGSAWLELDISQPLPLLNVLRKIPCVKEVVGARSYIIAALKPK